MRRAQMEIMGIAVVVILILFGMLFYIRVSVTGDKEESPQQQFQKASMVTYFIQAMLDSSIRPNDCDIEGRLRDLVSDCVKNAGCSGGDAINCVMCQDGASTIASCEYLEAQISGMLRETLDQQGRDYKFTIGSSDEIYVSLKSENCASVRQFREFPLASGEKVRMSMCE